MTSQTLCGAQFDGRCYMKTLAHTSQEDLLPPRYRSCLALVDATWEGTALLRSRRSPEELYRFKLKHPASQSAIRVSLCHTAAQRSLKSRPTAGLSGLIGCSVAPKCATWRDFMRSAAATCWSRFHLNPWSAPEYCFCHNFPTMRLLPSEADYHGDQPGFSCTRKFWR